MIARDKKMRILVVDDDPVTVEMLTCLIEQMGHEVLAVDNAAEALRTLGQSDCRLVITDWQMPEMDGLELCREIRKQERESYVYVILLTSRSGTRNIVAGLSAGADDFMSKPIDYAELEVRVRVGQRILSLETANKDLEQVSRLKSDFLAQISHEIRTPLSGIMGMTDIALEGSAPGEQREHLEIIRDSAGSLFELITDLLDFSKLDAGQRDLDCRPFPLRSWLSETVALVQVGARRKGLQLHSFVEEGTPEWLIGDPVALRQILVNLLGNAIKFTHEGDVGLRISSVPGPKGQLRLRVGVTDTGIGIAEDKQRLIFDAFAQAERYMTRKFGGTGLGLAISTRLVEAMGGRLQVESTLGSGSEFHFTVSLGIDPLEGAGERAVDAASHDPGERSHGELAGENRQIARQRILLAEDNAVNQKIAVRMLERWGHQVTTVGDGRAAVETFAAGEFDLVLMDIQMPEMDGLTAARAIRKLATPHGQRVAIVALTAHAHADNASECRAAGMDGIVTKPIDRKELFDIIAECAAKPALP